MRITQSFAGFSPEKPYLPLSSDGTIAKGDLFRLVSLAVTPYPLSESS
ncbi:MAG: hypothetical protein HFI90_07585 [Clostridia bacterium]|nr:hypothetical protein [Clostridia bacterium]